MDEINLFESLQYLMKYVRTSGSWVIAVCPDTDTTYPSCINLMAGIVPHDAHFSGRTILFPEGGKLTLVSHQVDCDFAAPFEVSFLGWGKVTSKATDVMAKWRSAAQRVISSKGDSL